MDRASLEARVREVAMRAMWDSVQAQVDAGAQALHLYPFGGLRNCLAKVSFGFGFG